MNNKLSFLIVQENEKHFCANAVSRRSSWPSVGKRVNVGFDTVNSSHFNFMMTSSNGNIFRVTGPLSGESTRYQWIPLKKTSDTEFWCFIWSATEQTVEKTIDTPVIWDAIALIMNSM